MTMSYHSLKDIWYNIFKKFLKYSILDLQKISGKNIRKQLLHMLILRVKLKDFMMLLTKFIEVLRLPSAYMSSSLSSFELNMHDTSEIKSMMTEIFKAFKVIDITPPELQAAQREGKGIAADEQRESSLKLVPALKKVHPDPDAPIRGEEAKLLAMTKSELIKAVHEDAKKSKIDPKTIESAKSGEQFKKIQDIHPNTKHAVLTVYKGNDRRNFDVHNPFKFADFGITKLDKMGPIIEKKKNKIVGELMISLGKRYEILKKIPKELRIQLALPAPALAQS
ncbi:hypothetical protein Tco_0611828 [Tanacetum coccineum]